MELISLKLIRLDCKEIKPVNPKGNQSWIFIGRTDAETETPILWPPDAKNWLIRRPWCWERVKVGGEGDDRGSHGWMALRTQWTWVWTSFGSWWWTRKPGVLHSTGLQKVWQDWVTELNWLKPKMSTSKSSLGGPVIRILGFRCHRLGFSSGWGIRPWKPAAQSPTSPKK